ncbi:MAG TPA: hypothetical protein VH186_09105 [Chloroflexia bacterium]|nr:hypothetical protein [Chloroflexia bacterium]
MIRKRKWWYQIRLELIVNTTIPSSRTGSSCGLRRGHTSVTSQAISVRTLKRLPSSLTVSFASLLFKNQARLVVIRWLLGSEEPLVIRRGTSWR